MKIGIQTWGTNGDIRPFVALAGGLTAAGHDVELVVSNIENRDYTALAQTMGFEVRHVGQELLDQEEGRRVSEGIMRHSTAAKQLRGIVEHFFNPLADAMFAASQRLCRDNELVIGHFLCHPLMAAAELAEVSRVNVATIAGIFPSRHVTPPEVVNLGQTMNRFWWWIAEKVFTRYMQDDINALRVREGLAPIKRVLAEVWCGAELNLVCNSPSLVERPPDWHEGIQLCGFFNISERDESWEMPPELGLFLDAGPAPVFMTFGSMMEFESDPGEIAGVLVEAAKDAGCRAIIQARWSEIPGVELPPEVFVVERIPHKYVFPRCAAVVHHGGAGTTQSATLAGCPSVVVEYASDQPYWGMTLHRRGLAPPMLHRRSLRADKLAKAIHRVLATPDMRRRAGEVGAAMRHENGVGRAVELLEQRFGRA